MQSIHKINPIVIFLYFVCVIFLGMMITYPLYLAASLALSFVTLLLVAYPKVRRTLKIYILAAIGICVINPLINTNGETVLFRYFNNRSYTLESLIYGAAMAMLFLTVINWFACYNAIITSDKFMYIFGGIIPSTSLLLSMVLHFVPTYQHKISAIGCARKSIGKGMVANTYKQKAQNGMMLISALISVALENSVITANSMRSRGYGACRRTSFSLYKFTLKDGYLLITELLLFMLVISSYINSGQPLSFFAQGLLPQTDIHFITGGIAYVLLMCLPAFIILLEAMKWKILKFKI